MAIISDPVYLAEPMVRTRNYQLEKNIRISGYYCAPANEILRPEGAVPHYLPGKNPFLKGAAARMVSP